MKFRGTPLLLGIAASVAVCCTLAVAAPAPSPDVPAYKSNLRVIYFGRLQSDRAKDFESFLENHFAAVGRGEVGDFRAASTKGFDVVLMDYDELKIVNNHIQMPPVPFDPGYSRPTVMIGATAALMSDRMRLKTGYL